MHTNKRQRTRQKIKSPTPGRIQTKLFYFELSIMAAKLRQVNQAWQRRSNINFLTGKGWRNVATLLHNQSIRWENITWFLFDLFNTLMWDQRSSSILYYYSLNSIIWFFSTPILIDQGSDWAPFCSGHHSGRCDLPQRALAPGVLHLHPLRQVSGRSTVHIQGRQALLRRVLRRALLQEVYRLLQADHRSDGQQWTFPIEHY